MFRVNIDRPDQPFLPKLSFVVKRSRQFPQSNVRDLHDTLPPLAVEFAGDQQFAGRRQIENEMPGRIVA
jgi:hypothetical protein